MLKQHNKDVRIIWDPVLSASAGFDFKMELNDLSEVLKQLYFITPNWPEATKLSGGLPALEGAEFLAKYSNVYLTGGHNQKDLGRDYVFFNGKKLSFKSKKVSVYEKHGSGCVFSTIFTANLARNYPLIKACLRTKKYMIGFIESNPGLLGYHIL